MFEVDIHDGLPSSSSDFVQILQKKCLSSSSDASRSLLCYSSLFHNLRLFKNVEKAAQYIIFDLVHFLQLPANSERRIEPMCTACSPVVSHGVSLGSCKTCFALTILFVLSSLFGNPIGMYLQGWSRSLKMTWRMPMQENGSKSR